MTAIEFGRNLHGQRQAGPRRFDEVGFGNRPDEITAQTDESFDTTVENALAGLHGVEPFVTRRGKTIALFQHIQGCELRFLRDPDGPLSLHVRMTSHRTDTGTLPADVAFQEQQVAHHLHILDATPVLRQPHAVNGDDPACPHVFAGGRLECGPRQPGFALDRPPVAAAHELGKLVEAGGVLFDESGIDDPRRPRRACGIVRVDDAFANSGEGREVAADLDLMILGADHGGLVGRHLQGRQRIDKTDQSRLAQRIEGHDRDAAFARLLQLMQHAGTVRADVLAEEKDALGVFEVFQDDGTHRHSDRLWQPYRGALVAHIGAVRQVIVAIQPRHQLIHEGSFQRGTARCIKHHGLGIQRFQLRRNVRKRIVPRHPLVAIGVSVPFERLGQSSLAFQIHITP